MAHLVDYVTQVGDKTLAALPLNELDVACLNELAYLPYQEELAPAVDWHGFQNLAEVLASVQLDQLATNFLLTKERQALLTAVLASQRFAGLRLGHYVNDVSLEYERQFAAMVWQLPDQSYTQLVFRGTDDSLVGWKEDFNMSYRRTIPAQEAAVAYLTSFLEGHEGTLCLSGHSKGGNLALYASAYLPVHLREGLTDIYVFDAPGLHPSVLTNSGYQAIRQRIKAYRPQETIVSLMLTSDLAYETLVSDKAGLEQHDMSNWQVADQAFVRADGLSQFSINLEKTISEWLANHSSQELKLFFDTFFDLFFTAGISSLNDLDEPLGDKLKALLATMGHLEKNQRDFMTKAIGQLLSLYQKHALETAWLKRSTSWQEFLGKWQSNLSFLKPDEHKKEEG